MYSGRVFQTRGLATVLPVTRRR